MQPLKKDKKQIMEYSKIIAVSGFSGLFELMASKSDGAILKSMSEKTSKFISSRIHQFTQLNTVEIYTHTDNVNLVEIFSIMQKSNVDLPDTKDNTALKSYFEKVYPEMDFERVYPSDMKKIVKWFDQLAANNIEFKLEEEIEEEEQPELVEEVVAKKTKSKKEEENKEEAPKKTARKKKAE